MAAHPEREHALVGLAHLPRPGDHAAAVDDVAQAVHVGVLGQQQLARQLGGAVQRARAVERKRFADARRPSRPAASARASANRVAVSSNASDSRAATGYTRLVDRNTTSAPCRRATSSRLTVPTRFVSITAAGPAVVRGEDGGLGRAVHQQVEAQAREREVVGPADVGVHELDPRRGQPREVPLRPAALEVVGRDDARGGKRSRRRSARFEPTKPAPPATRMVEGISGVDSLSPEGRPSSDANGRAVTVPRPMRLTAVLGLLLAALWGLSLAQPPPPTSAGSTNRGASA